jgi:predicted dehydrogenase
MRAEGTARRHRAAVIGCGWIGATADAPGQAEVLTHCHAYSSHPRLELAGVCDLDPEKARAAGARWGAPAFADVEALLAEARPDVVAVSAATPAHAPLLLRLARAPLKLVIAEKPLTPDVATSTAIVERYRAAGIPLVVNLVRRFDPAVADLEARLAAGALGEVLHATLRYTKGILHNGCHALDLANRLFGPCRRAKVLAGRVDHTPDDPTLTAFLEHERCPAVLLLAGDERAYSLFELDVVATGGRVQLVECGLFRIDRPVEDDPLFPGYRRLAEGKPVATGLSRAMAGLADHVVEVLDGGVPRSTGEAFLAAQRLGEALLAEWRAR